ncbi:putative PEP-binding protein [Pseudolysinimonas sp.]|uniref:putative PEP-binding protein n=1 Tax=Pseudolysinimonas sp. TaxID=2680009 RepID=UPI003F7F3E02
MTWNGIGIGDGVAVGPVRRMPTVESLADTPLDDPEERLAHAIDAVAAELERRAASAGDAGRRIVEATAAMARDPMLQARIEARMAAGEEPDAAVAGAVHAIAELLAAAGGASAERVVDLLDVGRRLVARVRGRRLPTLPESDEPFVLVADDLAPADAVLLDPGRVLGLVCADGGYTGHTAIIARARGVPAVLGVGPIDVRDGELIRVDAGAGTVARDTGPATAPHPIVVTGPAELADGSPLPVLANVGAIDEVAEALALGAEGIGLFRSELLWLEARTAPGRAEQSAAYAAVLRAARGLPVVIRTWDPSEDKPLPFLPPGLRGPRADETLLRDQLAALADAQGARALHVMAPMVRDAEEAAWFAALARGAGLRSVGVVVELPSLAAETANLAGVVDFVSIGTNDLTAQVLGVLRTRSRAGDASDPRVLRMVERAIVGARSAGLSVSVCGEAAADPRLAVLFAGMGATSISVAPPSRAAVHRALARVTPAQARAAVADL